MYPIISETVSTTDLTVSQMRLRQGNTLVRCQTAVVEVDFTLPRALPVMAVQMLLWDASGTCAFAMRRVLTASEGPQRASFYFVANMPSGHYAVSFCFSEVFCKAGTEPPFERILACNNLFAPFIVACPKTDGQAGYLDLAAEISIGRQCGPSANSDNQSSFPSFPWPSSSHQYSLSEIKGALQEVLAKRRPDLASLVSPSIPTCLGNSCEPAVFAAVSGYFHSIVGTRQGDGIATTGTTGYLLFGPYIAAKAGRYRVRIYGAVDDPDCAAIRADVVSARGTSLWAESGHPLLQAAGVLFDLDFAIPQPGVSDLEVRVFVDAGTVATVKSINVEPFEPDGSLNRALDQLLSSWHGLASLVGGPPVAVVYCAIPQWLPFLMALSDHIKEHENLSCLLVVPDDQQRATLPDCLPASILTTLTLAEVLALPHSIKPTLIATHGCAAPEPSQALLARFGEAKLAIFADFFQNSASSNLELVRRLDLVYFFLSKPAPLWKELGKPVDLTSGVASSVVDVRKVLLHRNAIASCRIPVQVAPSCEPQDYIILYLRYWSRPPYDDFQAARVARAVLETIEGLDVPWQILIVKSDLRIPAELYAKVMQSLQDLDRPAVDFAWYLQRLGLPRHLEFEAAENFFCRGLLCRALAHLVMDSSLSYSIAIHPNIVRPTKVVIGVSEDSLSDLGTTPSMALMHDFCDYYKSVILDAEECGEAVLDGNQDARPYCVTLQ